MTEIIEYLIEPMQYAFMQRAMLMAVLVGLVCAIFSCFLVLKGWSLMGDAVSHAVLPGIVLAYILAIPLSIGAFVAGLFCAIATGYVKENSRLKEDSIMGIIFSGMFALGLVIYLKVQPDIHLDHILFGNILGVQAADLWETGIICVGTLLLIILRRHDLLLYCFDQAYARAIGLPVKLIHYTLLVMLSLTIVASLKAVGVILVIAMLIAPGAIAYLISNRFSAMLIIASCVAVGSSITGVFVSFYLDADTGATIILIQTIIFIITFLFAPKSGILRTKTAI
ncbi:MAG: metal ABC transporter permease [OCS116 cluster bacterium]|uniref:Iron ABC transporter permease n=1 Tax=OCS116 cluster bacterium TaxID=2030921 RepID=A0A2A4YV19_9PROT|nr:metal ABC transporter permease [OCS116 cluster bacterium]